MAEQLANFAQTTLASTMTSGATTLTGVDCSSFPATGDFRVLVQLVDAITGVVTQRELMKATSRASNVVTVTRAQESTTAVEHDAGSVVAVPLTKAALETLLATKVDKTTATTAGDLYVATASGVIDRLGVGTTGQVLTANTALSKKIEWAAAAGGGIAATIVDAKGDLIVGNAADSVIRLASPGV